MRTLIVAVTCLAIGASLNAPWIGAKSAAETTINPFQTSDMSAELDQVRADLQLHFDRSNLDELQDFLVKTEWQRRNLAKNNAGLLTENNEQGWKILELRSKLRKCEKK